MSFHFLPTKLCVIINHIHKKSAVGSFLSHFSREKALLTGMVVFHHGDTSQKLTKLAELFHSCSII